ncbi:hypothetical protein B0H11DRAFT_2248826 [Mycena galericulata]|nr:hypothetical protein B0H11DRAFT_2248826 [Mycena galericulata]
MASWARSTKDADPAFPTDYPTNKALPPTPGVKPVPPSIAQLALPSPDDSSSPGSSSNESYEPPHLPVQGKRRPNRLRKPPPSSYPFSFVPEDPSPSANFPYIFHRPAPSPSPSFVTSTSRALSMHSNPNPTPTKPVRKLTKRRPSLTDPPATADVSIPELPPPPLQRRGTFNFTLRRKKTLGRSSQSEDGHCSLPPLPPPSPLALNIPTFRPFHARRRDSWHVQPASEPPVALRHSSPPASTDVFSQAAWTGVAPKNFEVIRGYRGGWKSTWSLSLAPEEPLPPRTRPKPTFTLGDECESPRSESPVALARPPLLRRDAVTAPQKRRWTLAMALNDEGISDELLVEKLEALRSRSRVGSVASCDEHPETAEWDRVWASYDDELDSDDGLPPVPPLPPAKDTDNPGPRTVSMPALPTSETATWQSARRALLTCRELVRTERHYLAGMQLLLSSGTRAPPPPLMRSYASALARESAGLLRRMEEDPSAWGVAAALLGAEEALEGALVGWCGVVGAWFVDSRPGVPKRLSKMRTGSEILEEPVTPTKWRMRNSSGASSSAGVATPVSSSPSLPAVPPPVPPIPSAGVLSASVPILEPPPSPFRARRKEKDPRPAVRDIAILPTQRVMRYVLLYRDLLEHTPPSSPARALVAQAVDTAVRIAQRCDRAQGNAAFLQRR